MTEIVYSCTPDRHYQLAISVGSLLKVNSTFDSITIYCEDTGWENWNFGDPRIKVKGVKRLHKDFVYGNKRYLCQSNAERVVFLDTDTFILKPLELLWENRPQDFMGRIAACVKDVPPAGKWEQSVWDSNCAHFGSGKIGVYNSGVIVFQNGSHRKLDPDWGIGIERYLSTEYQLPYPSMILPEQFSLCLTVGKQKLSTFDLNSSEHCFAWANEYDPRNKPVVLHTRDALFKRFATKLGYVV